ncbi:MAG: leucine-rich repeat domain-containing protein [Mycoplasma sp.]
MKLKFLSKFLCGLGLVSTLVPLGINTSNHVLLSSDAKNEEEVLANLKFEDLSREGFCAVVGCTNKDTATKIIIPWKNTENKIVFQLARDAFNGCPLVKTVEFEQGSNLAIYTNCFANCPNLKTIIAHDCIRYINPKGITNCPNLTRIYMSYSNSYFELHDGYYPDTSNYMFYESNNITIYYKTWDWDNENVLLNNYVERFQKKAGCEFVRFKKDAPIEKDNLGPVLGGVFGGIATGWLTAGGIVFYKRKNNKKNK